MKNKAFLTKTSMAILIALVFAFISCTDDEEPEVNEVAQMIEEVRAATQPFKSHSVAVEAGWDTDLSGCVAHPTEGGMGHHFGRLEFLDGRINHLEPQVLLFGADENGNMEFYGVEYIVPFAIHPEDAEPPTLFDQHFHPNHEQEFWALHVWTEKENPKGMFYDWNPNVSCN